MGVAPELQHLHSLVTNPRGAKLAVGKLLHGDRHNGPVAQRGEGGECPLYVVRDQLNDDVDVFGEAQIAMRAYCQPTRYQVPDSRSFQRGREGFEAGEFHGLSRSGRQNPTMFGWLSADGEQPRSANPQIG